MATQKATLVSGGDTFGGEVHGAGENRLGKLLMKVRANLVKASCEVFNVASRAYLETYGWTRNTDGDDIFLECWVPEWNEECYFDLDSAVHYQNKVNVKVWSTANDLGLLDDDDDDDDDGFITLTTVNPPGFAP